MNEAENGGVKAQFTTKLHFFALYQQNAAPQPGRARIFCNEIKDLEAFFNPFEIKKPSKLST